MSIKKDDQVKIIAGKDKDKTGKVIRIIRDENRKPFRIVVEKINIIKKHIKKTREKAGERIEIEAPIHISNVQIICPSCGKTTRIKKEVSKSGKKMRICKKCEASLERPFVKS